MNHPPSTVTTIQRLANRYEILRPVARGGQACVYLVRELDTGRELALKLLEVPEGQNLAEWRARFRQEYHTAARLRHPNVVTTFDYGETEHGVPFLTMEYLSGPGFDACLPMAPALVLKHLPGLLRALAYLHAQGWVHMDLKPENLKFEDARQETAKLMDMGLARRAGQIAAGLAGTFAYVPPEAIRNAPVDRRSDLYALGCVLHHLLTGAPPFQGAPRDVLRAHLEQEPPPLPASVPPALAALVRRMMAKSPLERFGSANEALAGLGFDAESTEEGSAVFQPPVAGRDAEIAAVDAALGRLKAPGAGYEELWLAGAPETELATLVDALRAHAQLAGAWTLQLRPAARAGLEVFAPLAQALLTRLTGTHDAAVAGARAALGPVLAPAPAPEADPAQQRLRVFTVLGQLLKLAAGRRPVALVVEPTGPLTGLVKEWLDHLHRLHSDVPVLALVGTHEEPEIDWRLEPHRQILDLEPLPPEVCAELTAAILGTRQVPEALAKVAFDYSGGQPGRLHALLQALASQGALARDASGWRVTAPDLEATLGVLDPARAFLLRLADLGPLAAGLLAVLALLDRPVPLWELWALQEAVSGETPEAAAHEALTELASLGFAAVQPGQAALAREIDRAALEAEFLGERRAGALDALVPALEARWLAEPADGARLQELARLTALAGDPEKAPRYGRLAAARLAGAFALESAEIVLAHALAAASDATSPEVVRALWHLRGDVARDQGDRRLAEKSYEAALALAPGGPERARVLVSYGRLSWTRGELEEADFRFTEARGIALQFELAYEATLAATWLGRVALARGDAEAARDVIPAALEAARAGGYQALVRENLAQWGYWQVAQGEGDPTAGLAMISEALQLIARDEATIELNACYALQGNALMALGRYPEARLAFMRNRDLCAEIGAAPHDEAQAWMRCATVDLELGDFTACRRAAGPAGALARMVGDRALLTEVRLIESLAALYQGDCTLYEEAGSAAAELAAGSDRPVPAAALTLRRAEAEGFSGQWSKALSLANEALGRMADLPGHALATQAQLLKAEALGHLGLAKPARAALAALADPRSEAHAARRRLIEARLAQADGDLGAARQGAEAALAAARRGGLLPLAAMAELLLSELGATPEGALAWARKALVDAESCQVPALAAEALFRIARRSPGAAQAEIYMAAAAEAWARATASFTPSQAAAFAAPESRRALAEALQLRGLAESALDAQDQEALVGWLSAGVEPDAAAIAERWLPALGERLGAQRVGLAFQDDRHERWARVGAWGAPEDDALAPEAEWEALRGLEGNAASEIAPGVKLWATGLSGAAARRFEAFAKALALPFALARALEAAERLNRRAGRPNA